MAGERCGYQNLTNEVDQMRSNEDKIKVTMTHRKDVSHATVTERGLWNLVRNSGATSLVVDSVNNKPVREGKVI